MQILALETSTDACSVAIWQEGRITVVEAVIPRQHTQRLLPMVTEVLTLAATSLEACQAIAFGCGPGSFTGVRMAAGVAQGLAFGLEVPVIPVSTLAAIAWQAQQQYPARRYVATLDARMQELYWAIYERRADQWLEVKAAQLTSYAALVAALEAEPEPALICGPGWSAYAPSPPPTLVPWPSASAIAELAVFANGVTAATALPTYVRNEVAHQRTDKL